MILVKNGFILVYLGNECKKCFPKARLSQGFSFVGIVDCTI